MTAEVGADRRREIMQLPWSRRAMHPHSGSEKIARQIAVNRAFYGLDDRARVVGGASERFPIQHECRIRRAGKARVVHLGQFPVSDDQVGRARGVEEAQPCQVEGTRNSASCARAVLRTCRTAENGSTPAVRRGKRHYLAQHSGARLGRGETFARKKTLVAAAVSRNDDIVAIERALKSGSDQQRIEFDARLDRGKAMV